MMQFLNPYKDATKQEIHILSKIYPHLKPLTPHPILCHKQQNPEIVPILAGGGSGHEPAHFGYVGQGMLTGAIAGNLFVPPKAKDILTAIHAVNQGKGVFLIIKNFASDLLEFQQAISVARQEGIKIAYIVSHDDISIDNHTFRRRHRGVAGTLFLHKMIGAAAEQGASLEELEQLALNVATNIASLGFSRSVMTSNEKQLPNQMISYGVGIHGESGYQTVPFSSSEQIAIELVNKMKRHFRFKKGQHYAILINNLGACNQLEEWIFTDDILALLTLEGVTVDFIKTGHLMTSLDMAGLSLSLCQLKDKQWLDYLKAPTNAFAW